MTKVIKKTSVKDNIKEYSWTDLRLSGGIVTDSKEEMLSKNFSKKELECRCGCGAIPKKWAIKELQELREAYGKPGRITSAMRCAAHNKAVGGAPKSKHVEGIAFDVAVSVGERYYLVQMAMSNGFAGIGIAKDFIHIDLRDQKDCAIWQYGKGD